MKILLVEDDEALLAVLTKSLTAQNYVVDAVKDGESGWLYGSTFEYDLIILDIMLPKVDGISLCQRFRTEQYTTPILLLTAQSSSTAKVQGLDAGADDYVVKPFDPAELVARIRALLRRGSSNPLPLLSWGDLLLNPGTCEVTYNGQPLTLTTKEYDLLELLLRHTHHVFCSDEILDRLWSSEEFPAEATVRSHIRRLRHKLSAAGAPADFISTMHGRGYYLKPTQEAVVSAISAFQPSSEQLAETGSASLNYPFDQAKSRVEDQYLDFLTETWVKTRPVCLEQLAELSLVVSKLKVGSLSQSSQQQAHQIAHKLVGTLGVFGLMRCVQTARHLEELLDSPNLDANQLEQIKSLAATLKQDINHTHSIKLAQIPPQQVPLWLIVNQDSGLTQSLTSAASRQGIQTNVVPTIEAAVDWLNVVATHDSVNPLPDAILLQLDSIQATNTLEFLQTLAQQYPYLPILIIGHQADLNDRLAVVRHGGRFLLESSLTPEQIITNVSKLLNPPSLETKVMIVDDDQAWLHTLPTLLQPWGLKVTTLADPEQFWTVIQAVNPDVLVLDVNMPRINGLELCQVLRSDPRWQRLPVLFLSVLTDPTTQNQAFTVGADDYLCKPVMGSDLANRILNRLQRMRVWAS